MDLRLEHLSKRFGPRLAVEIPSLTIRGGEFFTFVGPSGCGKSTTLNLIAGLEDPSTGTLQLGDRVLNALSPHERNIAFVFQSYALYPHRTVFKNLSFPLEMAGMARGEIRRCVEQTAAALGLAAHLDKRPAQLSGGERQRVALGRAMVREPRLFLFDEPLSNLDAPLRAQMRKELKRLHGQLGTTFIYVTHDQDEALSLSDRIAVMRDGSVQQCGTPREIYNAPASQFVASFFGTPPMNFLPAALIRDGRRASVQFDDAVLPLPGNLVSGAKAGPIVLGVRPEHLQLLPPDNQDGLPATISSVEMHGGQSVLELATASGQRLTAIADAESGHQIGKAVKIRFGGKLYAFDPETQANLTSDASTP